jgi:hypothetical protein
MLLKKMLEGWIIYPPCIETFVLCLQPHLGRIYFNPNSLNWSGMLIHIISGSSGAYIYAERAALGKLIAKKPASYYPTVEFVRPSQLEIKFR